MNPFELRGTTPDNKPASVWACGVCRMTALGPETAASCCGPEQCARCKQLVPRTDGRWDGQWSNSKFFCNANGCSSAERAERDAERLAKAPRVEESSTPMLYCDCCEKFFESSDELLERHYDDGLDLPRHAWACDEVKFSIDADEVVELSLERLEFNGESRFDQHAVDELQTVLNAWTEKFPMKNFFANNSVVDLTNAIAAFETEHQIEDRDRAAFRAP